MLLLDTSSYGLLQPSVHPEVCNKQKKGDKENQKEKCTRLYDTPSQRNRWNSDVNKMKQMFDDGSYIDIVSAPQGLDNFATGELATPSTQTSILVCLEKIETMVQSHY